MNREEARSEIMAALKTSSRNVEKAATYEAKRIALWDQTNSVLVAIAFELRCLAVDYKGESD